MARKKKSKAELEALALRRINSLDNFTIIPGNHPDRDKPIREVTEEEHQAIVRASPGWRPDDFEDGMDDHDVCVALYGPDCWQAKRFPKTAG